MSETLKGVLLAGAAAVFWGLMGVSAQFIMGTSGFTPGDLVSLRLMGSGVVLLGAMGLLAHRNIFRPIASKENFLAVLLYGAGVVAAQYFFFVAIEHTNAGTAAILVTTIPLMIIAWLFFAEHRPVSKKEMLCALLAVSGVVALITRGDFSGLHFSVMGLAAGLLSAAASAFYTLQPKKAIARIGVGPVISWGFFLGGLVMCFCYPPWESTAEWSWQAGAAYAYIVLLGTVGAFWCFLESTRHVSAAVSGLMIALEPLIAVVAAAAHPRVHFGPREIGGMFALIAPVGVHSLPDRRLLRRSRRARSQ